MTSSMSIPSNPEPARSKSSSISKHASSSAKSHGLGLTAPSNSNFAVGATGKRVQFVREEIYAIAAVCRQKNVKTGRANPPKSTGRAVIGELIREAPQYYKHLTNQGIRPIPPRLLWGKAPQDLVEWYEGLVGTANTIKASAQRKRYERGRRSTVPILLSAVASYPAPPDDSDAGYQKWRLHVVAWAKRHYGHRLISVCEHLDEGYGHVHCLAAHPDAQPARSLHSGHSAVDKAKAAGTPEAELGRVYRAALVSYQDKFFDRVGRRCGLDRLSEAPKPRLSYPRAKLQRELESERAAFDAKINARKEAEEIRAQKATQDLDDRITTVLAREVEADNTRMQLDQTLRRLQADRARLVIEKVDLDTKTAALRQEQSELAQAKAQLQEDLNEVARIRASREDLYKMWACAVRERTTSQDEAMQMLENQGLSTAPLLRQLGQSAPTGP